MYPQSFIDFANVHLILSVCIWSDEFLLDYALKYITVEKLIVLFKACHYAVQLQMIIGMSVISVESLSDVPFFILHSSNKCFYIIYNTSPFQLNQYIICHAIDATNWFKAVALKLKYPGGWGGGWFRIKKPSYQYKKSHCGDKTILRPAFPISIRPHLYIHSRPSSISVRTTC